MGENSENFLSVHSHKYCSSPSVTEAGKNVLTTTAGQCSVVATTSGYHQQLGSVTISQPAQPQPEEDMEVSP